MKTPKILLASLAAGLAALMSIAAGAAPITADQWYGFGFNGPGTALTSGSGFITPTNPVGIEAPDPAWTFTLSMAGQLTVLDLFLSSDQFEIFNSGVSLGLTSTPIAGGSCDEDIGCALADPGYSRGIFNLAPGSYSITGMQVLGQEGAGAFMVSTNMAVPEPGSILLFVLGLGLLGTLRFTRRAS